MSVDGKESMHFFRFHLPHMHLNSVFGDDWFALKAEAFARFFGTPVFLIGQTVVVGVWLIVIGIFEIIAGLQLRKTGNEVRTAVDEALGSR